MSDWLDDPREIIGVDFDGGYDRRVGDRFERIEHPGEYCFIPWIRIETWRRGHHQVIELPLNKANAVIYAPASVDERPQGQDPKGLEAKPASAVTAKPADAQRREP